MTIVASILKNGGLYAGAARRGNKLVATVLPVNDENVAKKTLMRTVHDENIDFRDDPICLLVSQKIFRTFRGEKVEFNEPIEISHLPPFQKRVLEATKEIPWGTVTTYSKLADKLGNKKAARAVGNALAANPLPLIIACHRVVKTNGEIGGFGGGPELKKKLLQNEGLKFQGNRIALTQ
ncbi:MAG: methylated-DNA--[protein]-cysteine S-methyltransferase [Candidatus Jordarchaeaceae archaeon]